MQTTENPEPNQRVQQQVNLRVMKSRRNRVWLRLGMFLLVSAGVVVVVMMGRDQLALWRCRVGAEAAATALQADVQARRPLPIELPIKERGHFHYRPQNSALFGMGNPVGICCCSSAHNLFLLRPNGRHVVINEGDKLVVRWVTEEEFAANKAAWNLSPSRIR